MNWLNNYEKDAVLELKDELCFEISLKYDVFLTPVVYSKNELKDKLTKITPFYRNVETEGIAI